MKPHRLSMNLASAVAALAIALWSAGGASAAGGPPPSERGQTTATRPQVQVGADVTSTRVPRLVQQELSYLTVPGTAFRPRGSSQGFTYDGNGCVRLSSIDPSYPNDSYLNAFLHLPDFSVLSQVRVFVRNPPGGSGLSGYAYLTRFDATGASATTDLIQPLLTSSAAGNSSVLSEQINASLATMDLYNYSYSLQYLAQASTHALCGMRVAYFAPMTFAQYLPVVSRR